MRTFVALFVSTLLVAPLAHAQTANLQAELNALLAQLAALQAQLNGTTATVPTPPVAMSAATCPQLLRTLRMGMSGADVSALQTFLASDTTVYPEKTVSGYFGMLTQNAVQRFQGKHGIVSSGSPDSTGFGAAGPATRAAIAALCKGGAQTSVPPIAGGCSLGGISVPAGGSATFYSTTQAPLGSNCAAYALVRQCSNGTFSGNAAYQFRSCVESEASSCSIDGERVAHGTSFIFFSKRTVNSVGENCSQYAQTRTCTNGALSGSNEFRYLSCKIEKRDSCTLGGVTVADGQSRTFYRYDMATSTNACSSHAQSRTCNDGVFSGTSDYSRASCSAGACLLDGVTYAHGSSSTFYLAQSIPLTEQCSSYAQTRTCSNGTFSGNASYAYRTCAPVAAGSCALDNIVLTSGQSRVFYSAASAPAGTACTSVAQTRTCLNGALSGSATYSRASCSDVAPCTLDGVTISHGSSGTFYSTRTVPYGTTCSSRAFVRTCTNGLLSGGTQTQTTVRTGEAVIGGDGSGAVQVTSEYQYASCSVSPPTSFVPTDSQFATALAALEALLKSALVQLDSWF